ncbi:MAG: aminoacyl-tRNA hydrolase [Ilumatobacteraceae bacterium]|nr:aminoacyl-tRNA hydrolase [Ilumatobacteraceae bacterium]
MAFRRSSTDSGGTQRFIIVGLGNPGKEYARTRHNIGQDTVELLASRTSSKLKSTRDRALISETHFGASPVVLAVPITFMNDSGESVGPMCRRFKITDMTKVIIVHDELDLEPGVVRIKQGGGLAGHNGLSSISHHLKTNDYIRVRIGIGKPRSKEQGADHVLNRISAVERKIFDVAVALAADAAELIVTSGLEVAMQRVNVR